ncbi:hypothetical protein [Mycobacterium shimoidei]|uniref:hypothetical protein n=1 Tax=Mycobacterium shimoidei TaxID=29313 RepID=UPI000A045CAC|nr:hypothetical protein [Mycobacterium shimoidei]
MAITQAGTVSIARNRTARNCNRSTCTMPGERSSTSIAVCIIDQQINPPPPTKIDSMATAMSVAMKKSPLVAKWRSPLVAR